MKSTIVKTSYILIILILNYSCNSLKKNDNVQIIKEILCSRQLKAYVTNYQNQKKYYLIKDINYSFGEKLENIDCDKNSMFILSDKDQNTNFLVSFETLTASKNSCVIEINIPIEGVYGKFELKKNNEIWSIVNFELYEK